MKILFVMAVRFYGDPIGIMQLSSVAKLKGHEASLCILSNNTLEEEMAAFNPDIVAYSVMTPNINYFVAADALVKKYVASASKPVLRIMGGPHPTFFPEVLAAMDLDAICIGEGEAAFSQVLDRFQVNDPLLGIPNIIPRGHKDCELKLIDDLDSIPFPDREILYRAAPEYQDVAIRSFLSSRGCPYRCSYCFNHAYNTMFRGKGKILRRRTVDNLLEEITQVVRNYPPTTLIKFTDDTFAHHVDDWLMEFVEKYPKVINIPMVCQMRSNTLTEETASLLKQAGCISVGMSIETGSEKVRNQFLKRNLSNATVRKSFDIAKKYGIATYGNTILGIPGTTLKDDYDSVVFAKSLKLTNPMFSIFSPYPKTELTNWAISHGYLDSNLDQFSTFKDKSILNCYTEQEKQMQQNMMFLGPLFCKLPEPLFFIFNFAIMLPIGKLYAAIGSFFYTYLMANKVFPNAQPKSFAMRVRHLVLAVRYSMNIKRKIKTTSPPPVGKGQ